MADNQDNHIVKARLTLTNRSGIHARSAAKIVNLVMEHDCRVVFTKDGRSAEADSILDLLTLNCPKGATVDVECRGESAPITMIALTELFGRKFDEDR